MSQNKNKGGNRVDIIEETIKTYDSIAPNYCRKTRIRKILEWEEDYIKKLISFTLKSEPLILDVGCGDGRHCIMMEKNGAKALGIDLSEGMLKEARTYYPDGDFRKMDIRDLLFDNDCFDGIWASGCIYHVQKSEMRHVISEFRRVLKSDGVLGLNFKLGEGEGLESNPKSYSGHPRYFAYYSKEEMVDLLREFGFEEIESCRFPEEIFGDNLQQMWFRFEEK